MELPPVVSPVVLEVKGLAKCVLVGIGGWRGWWGMVGGSGGIPAKPMVIQVVWK